MSALTAVVALVELLTPAPVVLAYLYVLPLILLSETARPQAIWRYTALACAFTLANLVIPEVTPFSGSVLTNRLLVCGALVLTARQCLRIQGLQRQRLELQGQLAVEDLRRDFVATLAHDLKTPILGTIATLRSLASARERSDGALLQRAVDTMERGQSRALLQIQTLLDVYRNDAEGLLLHQGSVDFTRLVEEVIREMAAMAEERQLTLRLGFGETSQWHPHQLWGDVDQLRRLVENLLLNAIHHSLRGGQIQLELENRGSGLLLRVADGGPGVPEPEIPKLFQRFQRLSEERPGSGLGLYLCRQIVDAHGGTIGLRNRPGGGAEIEVLLPQGRDDSPAEGG
ncbi:MAG: HAMP domain-containing sensor histidine kinase [Prochlorococcaceae cyanobacterium]